MPKTVLLSNGFSLASPAFQQAKLYDNCTMDSAKVLIPCSRFTPATILPALPTTSTGCIDLDRSIDLVVRRDQHGGMNESNHCAEDSEHRAKNHASGAPTTASARGGPFQCRPWMWYPIELRHESPLCRAAVDPVGVSFSTPT
jgi:hypothetical protein